MTFVLMDILDLINHGPEKIRGYRDVLVEIDNSSKYGGTIPLKNKKCSKNRRLFWEHYYMIKKKTKFFLNRSGKGIL